MANEAQIAAWDGINGERWVRRQKVLDEAYGAHGLVALDAADLRPGDSVLDVGCGTGDVSLESARRVGARGLVVGVDISRSMLALARTRAAAEPGLRVRFEHADAQLAPLGTERFDRMVSRFGVMFFDDPVVAFSNIRGALRHGGRVAFAAWQSVAENPLFYGPERAAQGLVELPPIPPAGTPGPFAFADAEVVRTHLGRAGFSNVAVDPVSVTVAFPGSVEETAVICSEFSILGRALLNADDATKTRVHEAVSRFLEPFSTRSGVQVPSEIWRVTATRGSD